VWLCGVDWGIYADVENGSYLKDIPLEKALSDDVLVAYEMNGGPLPAEHGFPLRAIVPGYYGTNSVKWLSQISVQSERPQSLFTTRLYNTVVDGVLTPVWAMAVNSRLTTPGEGDVLALGDQHQVAGWAWGDARVVAVDVSVDGGKTWARADLDDRDDGCAWQGFRLAWTPGRVGAYGLVARATDARGAVQPQDLHINQAHFVSVTVR
ncbi:MAG: molybdopterin-dependent oxidoreductase, partial [Trebonia sp.]